MRINSIKSFISCIILLLFCSLIGKNIYAQEADTLIFREIEIKKTKRKVCSFRTITNVGFALPPKDNTYYRMQYGKSLQGMFGFQFKARLAKFYSMGADLMVTGNRYAIWQDEGKWFTDQNQNRKEFFRDGELSLAFTHQFKLNKGIKQTWAIDVSIYGAYVYSASHKTINIDHNPDNIYSGKTRTVVVERDLPYIERWLWGFRAGLTYHGVGIYVQYRMNNLVKLGLPSQYDAFDMPKLSLGLTFSGKMWGN
jgi:hypothetical protein